MIEANVPLIDLSQPDAQVQDQLQRAFSSIGFACLSGHGITPDLVQAVRDLLEQYFSRSEADKLRDSITPDNYRGYIPLGFFSPNTPGGAPDQYEGYKLHFEVSPDDPLRQACDLYGPNLWPQEPAAMKETLLEYWRECDRVTHRLLRLLATIMGVNSNQFLAWFEQPLTNMTLLHYPSQDPEQAGFGIHPHKDTDALTLLFPDPVGGLWLRGRGQSDWLEVKAPPHTIVVNIGDLLELWSGGYFVSTPHKVINRSGAERYSFPFFVVPRHDVIVAPLMPPQPGFTRQPVPVGPVSREVWRTNWPTAQPDDTGFDLGTLSD